MTKGTIGVVACPAFDDEIVYILENETEKKNVYLVDDENAVNLKKRLDRKGIGYTSIDMDHFTLSVASFNPEEFNIVIMMNSYALHAEPKDLVDKVQDEVLTIQGKYDVIMAMYGLCGNISWDLPAWAAAHNVTTPVVIFRDDEGRIVDDCVAESIGGLDAYRKLLRAHTGQLLIIPSVANNWETFISSSDLMKGASAKEFGCTDTEMMRMIFEIAGYKHGVELDTGLTDREEFHKNAEMVCENMGLTLLQPDRKWTELGPLKRIYREAKSHLRDVQYTIPE